MRAPAPVTKSLEAYDAVPEDVVRDCIYILFVSKHAFDTGPSNRRPQARRGYFNQGQQGPNLRQQAEVFLQDIQSRQETKQEQDLPQPINAAPPVIIKKSDSTPPEELLSDAGEVNHSEASNGTQESSQEVSEDGEKVVRKNKPFWVKGPGKVNKKELRRRRNLRLRKILQPKNALMVLNELVGSAPYEVSDLPDPFNGSSFQCTVQVEGVDHVGHGKSKPAAKNAAAEAALKHMVLGKLKNLQSVETSASQEGDVEVKMEIEEGTPDLSWSHVACYALHKLLNSWDEGSGASLADKVGLGEQMDLSKNIEKKPAKKLPDLANTMNPVMLLNQMLPSAAFEELAKEGNPPHILFTVKCVVGNDTFYGTGTTKKAARRMCAFAACRHILGIQYPPAFLEEQGFSEDSVKVVPGPNN
ncbi:hypothetical protein FQR65_LT13586 [Abscondita terminalis]|nr:hypothetical protein FQR65_LT13586 [Abscondita terminalis]